MKTFKNTTLIILLSALLFSSCEKLVEVNPSANSIDPISVYADSAGVQSALIGMYNGLSNIPTTSLVTYGGVITTIDDLSSYELTNTTYPQYQNSALTVADAGAAAIWSDSYANIYRANSIIEGVEASSTLTNTVKNRAVGEAKFIRAFCHFYLVNTFGAVPIITGTNPSINSVKPQSPASAVYQQIIADLKDAVELLPPSYSLFSNQRIRANKFVAAALLAKAYLYTADWADAEIQASSIISNTTNFKILDDQTTVFLANSMEAIWQLDSRGRGIPFVTSYFVPLNSTVQPSYIVSSNLMSAFEATDTRKNNWIKTSAGLPYPAKYSSTVSGREYDIVFRLAEQYLIRAEARARLNNTVGAKADVDVIRKRANLLGTAANDLPSMLLAIEKERQTELFCEWGNRLFDLKRTGRADAVLGAAKPGSWKSTAVLFPIPVIEIGKNLNLVQNNGYN